MSREEQLNELRPLEEQQIRQRKLKEASCRPPEEGAQQEREIYFTRGPVRKIDYDTSTQGKMIVVVPDALYKPFLRKTYAMAIIFILIAFCVNLTISITKLNLQSELVVRWSVWALVLMVIYFILDCYGQLKRRFPINWFIVIILVAVEIVYMAYGFYYVTMVEFFIGYAVASAIMVILILISNYLPTKFLPGGLISLGFTALCALLACIFFALAVFLKSPIYHLLFYVFIFSMTIVMVPVDIQFIHGRRSVIPLFLMIFSAFKIFFSYMNLIMSIKMFYNYYIYENGESFFGLP